MSLPHLVERLNWRRGDPPHYHLLPGGDRVAAFPTRDAAEEDARDREWALRRRINPFHCGGPRLFYQTRLPAPLFHDFCLDLELHPPGVTDDSTAWADWWTKQEPDFTPLQRAAMWERLDRVRFFRVTDNPPGIEAHVVGWRKLAPDPNDDFGLDRAVGLLPVMLVRLPELAVHHCRTLYTEALAGQGEYFSQYLEPSSWDAAPPFDAFSDGRESANDDDGLPRPEQLPIRFQTRKTPQAGMSAFILCRRHWMRERQGESWRWTPPSRYSPGRPIQSFDTLADADILMTTLEMEARDTASAFRFGPPQEWSHLGMSEIWGMLSDFATIDFTNLWQDYRAPDRLWSAWWDTVRPTLTPEQVALVWSLYDKLRFYEVVEVEYRES